MKVPRTGEAGAPNGTGSQNPRSTEHRPAAKPVNTHSTGGRNSALVARNATRERIFALACTGRWNEAVALASRAATR
jgi:hypothetical protein